MPKAKTGLTVAEYAVLGLLSQGRDYGYRLQQHFAGPGGLALVLPVEPSALYAILKSLSGLELIDGEWDRTQYPPRAVFSLTPEGQAAFERWLVSPVERMREVRADLLVKLYFALQRGGTSAGNLIGAQISVCQEYEHRLQDGPPAGAGAFEVMVWGSKLTAARSTRRWLEEAAALFSDPARAPRDAQTPSTNS